MTDNTAFITQNIHDLFQSVQDTVQTMRNEQKSNHQRLSALESHHTYRPELDTQATPNLPSRTQQKACWGGMSQGSTSQPVLKDTPEDNHFRAYLRKGVVHPHMEEADHARLSPLSTKTLSSGAENTGGFLAPATLQRAIQTALQEKISLRALCSTVTITTGVFEIVQESKEITAGWVGETDDRPATQTSEFTKIKIPVHEIYAKPQATQRLLDDAHIDVASWLADRIVDKISHTEENAFINGDGDKKPRGLLHYAQDQAINASERIPQIISGHKGEIKSADLLFTMVGMLKTGYLNNAVWLMSRSTQAALRRLKDTSGHYLWQPHLGDKAGAHIMGYPVVVCDHMPELVTGTESSSLFFGSLKDAYQIVDHDGIHILRDPYSAKPYVEFYCTRRVGGMVKDPQAMVLLNCKA